MNGSMQIESDTVTKHMHYAANEFGTSFELDT